MSRPCGSAIPLPARLLRAICASLAATLGALAFTLPLAAWYFRSISLAAPLTNLLALPLFSLAFSLGCITAVLGLVWLPLGRIAAWPAAWLLRLARGIVTTAAGLPYAAVYLNRTLLCVWLIAATGMFVIFLLQRRRQPGVFAACLAVTLTAAILGAALWETDPVSMTALDVGQGACTVLRGGGATFVVDCGGEGGEAAGETAARELRMGGETSVDGLILTHLDADPLQRGRAAHGAGAGKAAVPAGAGERQPRGDPDCGGALRHGDRLCHGGSDA